MIYKLTYDVALQPNSEPVEVLADDEIELARALLDMERDVGMWCYNVKIDKVKRPENFYRINRTACLQEIQYYAKALEKAKY
jgi:hypothetical protein